MFIQCYLIFSISAIILVLAPETSADKNIVSWVVSGAILLAAIVYPLWMVISCRRNKEKFNTQKVVLALFFSKRIAFLLITFLISNGSLQSLSLSLVYLASMIIFGLTKPLGHRSSNLLGMVNDFLLLAIIIHTSYFTGVQDEAMKYDIGMSMLILIAVFAVLNITHFVNKLLRNFRLWLLT